MLISFKAILFILIGLVLVGIGLETGVQALERTSAIHTWTMQHPHLGKLYLRGCTDC